MKLYQKTAICFLAVLVVFGNLAADYLFVQKSRSAATSGESRIQLDPVNIYGQTESTSFGYARIKVASFDTTIAGVGRISIDYFFPPLDQFYISSQPEARLLQDEILASYKAQMPYRTNWFKQGWI